MTSIAAVGPPVDLAVIVIRPGAILDAAKEAADPGITNLLILPGGFAEACPIGVQRNQEPPGLPRQGARPAAHSDNLSDVRFCDVAALKRRRI